jgi:pyruvate/2-oxoglutarate dehydrogenase complex dihydrolipoamide acyltransferase (E2) component
VVASPKRRYWSKESAAGHTGSALDRATAKAVVEVPVQHAGRVLHAGLGDVVNVGQPLITVDPPDESSSVLIGYSTSAVRPRRRRAIGGGQPAGPVPPNGLLAGQPPHPQTRATSTSTSISPRFAAQATAG